MPEDSSIRCAKIQRNEREGAAHALSSTTAALRQGQSTQNLQEEAENESKIFICDKEMLTTAFSVNMQTSTLYFSFAHFICSTMSSTTPNPYSSQGFHFADYDEAIDEETRSTVPPRPRKDNTSDGPRAPHTSNAPPRGSRGTRGGRGGGRGGSSKVSKRKSATTAAANIQLPSDLAEAVGAADPVLMTTWTALQDGLLSLAPWIAKAIIESLVTNSFVGSAWKQMDALEVNTVCESNN